MKSGISKNKNGYLLVASLNCDHFFVFLQYPLNCLSVAAQLNWK